LIAKPGNELRSEALKVIARQFIDLDRHSVSIVGH
jgi:hypothetical protein